MTDVRDIGEFGLIDRVSRILPGAPSIIEGIGDDCAVVRIFDRQMLLSCDMFVENVHFRRSHASPQDIGWKAATSALSDIAAMGGMPLFCLVSLGCPPDMDITYVEAIYHGLADAAGQAGAVIVGGDTARCQNELVIDITVVGEVLANRYLSRRGAQSGDFLGITGRLGLSAAGLWALENGHNVPVLTAAHHHPHARISEGQWLSRCKSIRAMIDISDGLVQDAGHLARMARLGLEIDPEQLPVSPDLHTFCQEFELNPLDFILGGGEDYELAFVIHENDGEHCLRTFRREFRTPIHVIGRFTNQWQGVRVAGKPVEQTGYQHFR